MFCLSGASVWAQPTHEVRAFHRGMAIGRQKSPRVMLEAARCTNEEMRHRSGEVTCLVSHSPEVGSEPSRPASGTPSFPPPVPDSCLVLTDTGVHLAPFTLITATRKVGRPALAPYRGTGDSDPSSPIIFPVVLHLGHIFPFRAWLIHTGSVVTC